MKKIFVVALAAAALVTVALPATAPATIHEIVAAWCAGHGELEPPGLQDGKNFAMPVNAGGVVSVHPFTGASGPGLLIDFDFDKAQAKIVPTGQILVIGTTPAGPLYIEDFIPDPNFPAFSRCPNFDF
jgi:hypothetical protein